MTDVVYLRGCCMTDPHLQHANDDHPVPSKNAPWTPPYPFLHLEIGENRHRLEKLHKLQKMLLEKGCPMLLVERTLPTESELSGFHLIMFPFDQSRPAAGGHAYSLVA